MSVKSDNAEAIRAMFSKAASAPSDDVEAAFQNATADAKALLCLAEIECPADIIRFGENHRIPTFARLTWQAGFVQGWRMAMAALAKEKADG